MVETRERHEVLLGPGDLHFGDADTRIRTLLGSCVAVTLWHPVARIGGMCHYVVPTRHRTHLPGREANHLSGHYADEAMQLLLDEILASGTRPEDYQVKMFGGGNQFTGVAATVDVASRNVQTGLELVRHLGLTVTSMHVGGSGHRQVIFDISNGHVWMRHVERDVEGVGES